MDYKFLMLANKEIQEGSWSCS